MFLCHGQVRDTGTNFLIKGNQNAVDSRIMQKFWKGEQGYYRLEKKIARFNNILNKDLNEIVKQLENMAFEREILTFKERSNL